MTNIWWGSAGFRRFDRRAGWMAACVFLLSLAVFVSAVPNGALAQSYRFGTFVVEGNQRVDNATVLSYADIAPGETVGSGALNQAFQDLMDSGLFESVELVPQGGTLLIRVQEFPTINRIAIEGNRRLDEEDLLQVVRSAPRRVFSPTQAQQDASNIVDAYESQGLLAATVTPKIIRRSENRVDLVFEVTEGRVVENQRVSFVGNRVYSDRRLRRVLETKQAGLLRAFFRNDVFVADRIEFDITVLRDFYLSRGYIDFEVLDVSTELARERNATFITFQVREGQQFRFGALSATSDLDAVDPEAYLKVAKLREGAVYSPTLLENAIERMEELATQDGLDFVRVDPRVTRNDRSQTLDIEFSIVRGERIFVERIDIEGNQTTLDRVIRRQFRTVEGDPFNPREIRAASNRIRALNYFSTVDVNSREGSAPDQVVIDVDVEEVPTGSLGAGASYSSDNGLGLALNFSERNFLGRGQILNFDLNTTSESGTSQLSFTEPALLGRDLALTLSIFNRETDNNNASFTTRSTGAQARLGFPTGRFSRLSTSYTFLSQDLGELSANNSPILQAERGSRTKSSIGYTWTYDTRNRGIDRNAGVLLQFGQEFAGVGGDVEYIRTQGTAIAQRRFRNEDYTVRAVFEAGNVTGLGDYITTVNDRFFLSSSQLRGFDFRGMGPRDLDAVAQDPLAGNNFVSARFEFGFPIGLVEDAGISGGLFLDVGSVWGLDNTNGAGGVDSVDDGFNLRSSIGLSIFWETALGPLVFNFSEAIKSESYDKTRSFDVTVSTRF
ncbi:outer membrane protein assembly factor BamA [Ovoidimarina sediminis]|uniref:outer membrane protein assembly factor BamA n=1 Tax=Ovoidimarina sediminis TaxID=3079856 RepID=UPI0029135D8C|nr:outer membrane protein assembly factor BamA [Rhodophyticola sp. MJ-SS7]MDU8941905.1 outer membrane protein assembly factor BamA [Rhodophyticola sp. MJ-SS7]